MSVYLKCLSEALPICTHLICIFYKNIFHLVNFFFGSTILLCFRQTRTSFLKHLIEMIQHKSRTLHDSLTFIDIFLHKSKLFYISIIALLFWKHNLVILKTNSFKIISRRWFQHKTKTIHHCTIKVSSKYFHKISKLSSSLILTYLKHSIIIVIIIPLLATEYKLYVTTKFR